TRCTGPTPRPPPGVNSVAARTSRCRCVIDAPRPCVTGSVPPCCPITTTGRRLLTMKCPRTKASGPPPGSVPSVRTSSNGFCVVITRSGSDDVTVVEPEHPNRLRAPGDSGLSHAETMIPSTKRMEEANQSRSTKARRAVADLQTQDARPRTVGGYRLLRSLGRGGFGEVFLGEAEDGTRAAVKMLHANWAGDADRRRRFSAEEDQARKGSGVCVVAMGAA